MVLVGETLQFLLLLLLPVERIRSAMAALPPIDLRHHKVTTQRNKARLEWEHLTRQGAYADRTDLVHHDWHNLPGWVETPFQFFQLSEKCERRGGRWASVLRCTLPRGLTLEQEVAHTWQFVREVFPRHVAFFVIHEPMGRDGLPQPHTHILFSSRKLDGIEREPEQFFARHNSKHPDWGGALKDREHVDRNFPLRLREVWCCISGEMLEAAHVEVPPSFPVLQVVEKPAPKMSSLMSRIMGGGR